MYESQTLDSRAVGLQDAPIAGRVFVIDYDPSFDDDAPEIALKTQRRRRLVRGRLSTHRVTANDHSRGEARRPKIDLVLYTSAASVKSQKAIRAVRLVLSQYNAADYHLRICDLASQLEMADEDGVVFTPTLVKRGPGPRTWIVGDLDEPSLLTDLLDVNGVRRNGR